MTIVSETIWQSNNNLWEVILEDNDLFVYNKKDKTRYSVTIDKDDMWRTSIMTNDKIPAYVLRELERGYSRLEIAGDIM